MVGQGLLSQYFYANASSVGDGFALGFLADPGTTITASGNAAQAASYTTVNPLAALFENTQGRSQSAGCHGTGSNGKALPPDGCAALPGGYGGTVGATLNGSSVLFDFGIAGSTKSVATPVYGVDLVSSGGQGGDTASENYAGAAGGAARTVGLTVNDTSITAMDPQAAASGSAAIGMRQVGGSGGLGEHNRPGGAGGAVDMATLSLTDSTLTASGANIGGARIVQLGGNGGDGLYGQPNSNGGAGGSTQGVSVVFSQMAGAGNCCSRRQQAVPSSRDARVR